MVIFEVSHFLKEAHLKENVLEVGFEPVFSDFQSKSHAIIESNPKHFLEASKWANGQSNISIFQDSWEEVLPKLGFFDVIFYQSKSDNPQELGGTLLDQSQELISSVHSQIPQLKTIRYSDEDIENFYQQAGHLNREQTVHFLLELKKNQQITKEQYENFIEKYNFEMPQKTTVKMVDPIFRFFEACSEKHMKPGSYLISISSDSASKCENPQFFEHIITNSHFDYQEDVTSKGLVIRIKKL